MCKILSVVVTFLNVATRINFTFLSHDSLLLILSLCYQLLRFIVIGYVVKDVLYSRVGPVILGPAESAIPWVYYYLPMHGRALSCMENGFHAWKAAGV